MSEGRTVTSSPPDTLVAVQAKLVSDLLPGRKADPLAAGPHLG